jgi:hypothetical protein
VILWQPQKGPQKALVDCPVHEIFYGGARGGGKTDGVIGKMGLKALRYGRGFNGMFFRRELPMLDDAIARSHEIYGPLGGRWIDQKKTWIFPNGARFRFRPLERLQDAEKYQGQNITDVCIEEAGNYPDPAPIMRLHGVLRSAQGVPTQMHLTGNPGGPGQHWIKQRYIDPCPAGMLPIRETIQVKTYKVTRSRVFIPAKVWDNKLLLTNDPGYIAGLHLVGSEALVKAWLDGDWSAIEGAFFDCWSSEKHILRPFPVPETWTRFRSMDWGSARPFSVGWWAIVEDDYRTEDGRVLPRGAIVRYREWYGSNGKPNVGLKLTVEQVAAGIKEREQGDTIQYGVADPSIFQHDGGPAHAERFHKAGILWRPGDNARVPLRGAMGGWDQMRARMIGHDGSPMLYVFDGCKDFIRTVPVLQHDPDRLEDLDTDSEDHVADEARYACMSRPYTPPAPKRKPTADELAAKAARLPTYDEIMAMHKNRRTSKGRI